MTQFRGICCLSTINNWTIIFLRNDWGWRLTREHKQLLFKVRYWVETGWKSRGWDLWWFFQNFCKGVHDFVKLYKRMNELMWFYCIFIYNFLENFPDGVGLWCFCSKIFVRGSIILLNYTWGRVVLLQFHLQGFWKFSRGGPRTYSPPAGPPSHWASLQLLIEQYQHLLKRF